MKVFREFAARSLIIDLIVLAELLETKIMGRVPLKNAYTIIYERAGMEVARYSLTAFNPSDAQVDADRRFAKAHPEVDIFDASVSRRVET